MCGIVGYIGAKESKHIIVSGLRRLEYRGYDSSGAAFLEGNAGSIEIIKTIGKVQALADKIEARKGALGGLGVGHTRWATHGAPSDINSHPHLSSGGTIALVHNGIIDNYRELKQMLEKEGHTFVSETDTEVASNLLEYNYNATGDMLEAMLRANSQMEGAYALGILCLHEPTRLFAMKKQSPLVIGLGTDESLLASDFSAVVEHTRNFLLLEEGECAILERGSAQIYDAQKNLISREIYHVDWDIKAAEKDGHPHFMIKEMLEQPKAVRDTLGERISSSNSVVLEGMEDLSFVKDLAKIHILACGSSWHAGIVGKTVIERLTRISVEVHLASEFRYSKPLISPGELVIAISQSGETADTIGALRYAKEHGLKSLGIVNVVGSTIARESDYVLYTRVGPEVAVATTKAYSGQLVVLYLIAISFSVSKGVSSKEEEAELVSELIALPSKISELLSRSEQIMQLAQKFHTQNDVFLIGRGLDYAAVMEGSLKLKEISYIHSEAYAAGELKHGTISLIEEGTLVIAVATSKTTIPKTLSNLEETRARGAQGFVIAQHIDGKLPSELSDVKCTNLDILIIPDVNEMFSASLTAIPMQLFAYHMANMRGCDIDMPKHLAKSVTVE